MKLNLAFLALLTSLFFNVAHADKPAPPNTYKKVTENKKYVFVMLAGPSQRSDEEKLGAAYKTSGLYLNDGSIAPLWTVDWYAFDIYVSSDGQHLVRNGEWPQIGDKGETTAFSFYENGKEIKNYKIKDLVPDPDAMPKSVSHYSWCQSWVFDDARNSLTIETEAGENSPSQKYQFDITTGEMANIADAAPAEK